MSLPILGTISKKIYPVITGPPPELFAAEMTLPERIQNAFPRSGSIEQGTAREAFRSLATTDDRPVESPSRIPAKASDRMHVFMTQYVILAFRN